jgi:hypothetical protein
MLNWSQTRSLGLPLVGRLGCIAVASLLGVGCGGELQPTETEEEIGTDQAAAKAPLNLDPRRSLVVTEQPILARFPLERVLDQIIATSGVSGLTAKALFQQWWDTQNPGPGLDPAAPHCDDSTDADGNPTLNGYPYACRPAPAEGGQAACDPFADPDSPCAYFPIGLFMRFDAAPEDGSNCGEYRIVYAKRSGRTAGLDRNLLIFEAAMRNPHENQGIRGCKKLVKAWADLSTESDIEERADKLEEIYFEGYHEFDPVVTWSNFGDNADGIGQVRTNQFMQAGTPKVWSLREFKIQKQCGGGGGALRFVPATDKGNPFGPLFDPVSANANAPAFRAELLTKVEGLAAPGLGGIAMGASALFSTGQSQASGTTETRYTASFGPGPSSLRSDLQAKLTVLGSTLTPDDIVERAQAMSCAGCHKLSSNQALGGGLIWPASLGFTHISERDADLESVDGVLRYRLSPALENELLPQRKQLLEDYLNGIGHPAKPPKHPIGRRWTH